MTRWHDVRFLRSSIPKPSLKALQKRKYLSSITSYGSHTHTLLTNIRANNFASGTQNQHVHHSSYVSRFHAALMFSKKCLCTLFTGSLATVNTRCRMSLLEFCWHCQSFPSFRPLTDQQGGNDICLAWSSAMLWQEAFVSWTVRERQ